MAPQSQSTQLGQLSRPPPFSKPHVPVADGYRGIGVQEDRGVGTLSPLYASRNTSHFPQNGANGSQHG
eukprot:1336482-Heterocapsa_arctica.AAC.1